MVYMEKKGYNNYYIILNDYIYILFTRILHTFVLFSTFHLKVFFKWLNKALIVKSLYISFYAYKNSKVMD